MHTPSLFMQRFGKQLAEFDHLSFDVPPIYSARTIITKRFRTHGTPGGDCVGVGILSKSDVRVDEGCHALARSAYSCHTDLVATLDGRSDLTA